MATARVIPREDIVQPINFTYSGTTLTVSSPAIIVGATDSITFANLSATATISIAFAANPPVINPTGPTGPVLFNSMILGPGSSNAQTPMAANGSVNYTVTAGGTTFGPYSIQVGAGPLYVQVASSQTTPETVSLPKGGTLEMYSTDVTYYVSWTAMGDPFATPPGLTEVLKATSGSDPNVPHTVTANVALYVYALGTSAPAPDKRKEEGLIEISRVGGPGGGGKVVVQT
jgi:hypothetical protein